MKDIIFLIDFDKTITLNDSTDELMKMHNKELVIEYQNKFRRKEIRVRDYIKELLESLKLTEEEYKNDVSKNVVVDPYFKKFINLGYEIRIVSAGAYENILPIFAKHEIRIPERNIYSNKVSFKGRSIEVTFPHDNNEAYEGICKKSIVKKYKKEYKRVIFIGDGHSDIPVSKEADILFAKKGKSLEKYCIENNIEHISYETFKDVIEYIKNEL